MNLKVEMMFFVKGYPLLFASNYNIHTNTNKIYILNRRMTIVKVEIMLIIQYLVYKIKFLYHVASCLLFVKSKLESKLTKHCGKSRFAVLLLIHHSSSTLPSSYIQTAPSFCGYEFFISNKEMNSEPFHCPKISILMKFSENL